MAEPVNLNRAEWSRESEEPGFHSRATLIANPAGNERIGASLIEVDPGNAPFPYHFHHANEEHMLVVSGRPSLRTPESERGLEEGDYLIFPRGERGAHQVINRTSEPVRILVLSEMRWPDVVIRPDSGKFGFFIGGAPGAPGREMRWFPLAAEEPFWRGEVPPDATKRP